MNTFLQTTAATTVQCTTSVQQIGQRHWDRQRVQTEKHH